jgi:hypothetical protein
VIGSGKRYLFSEPQGPERTEVLIKFNLDEYPILAALLSDSKDFGGNGSHRCHFLVWRSSKMHFHLILNAKIHRREKNHKYFSHFVTKVEHFCNASGRVRLRPNRNRRPTFDVRGFAHESRGTRFLLKIPGQPQSLLRRSFALPSNLLLRCLAGNCLS